MKRRRQVHESSRGREGGRRQKGICVEARGKEGELSKDNFPLEAMMF
jgi:hypothetical protein